jgi:hypothetical protein
MAFVVNEIAIATIQHVVGALEGRIVLNRADVTTRRALSFVDLGPCGSRVTAGDSGQRLLILVA